MHERLVRQKVTKRTNNDDPTVCNGKCVIAKCFGRNIKITKRPKKEER
jgi:hypothetical protein